MRELKRNGVTLDMCSTCRGVWLDRGELENLVNSVLAEREAVLQARVANDRDDDRGMFGGRRGRDDDDDSPLDIIMDILR